MSNIPAKSNNTKGVKSFSTSSIKNFNALSNFSDILTSSHTEENKILHQNCDSYNILSNYYNKKDNNSRFMEKINKMNAKFYACSEKFLLVKSNLDKLSDALYLNLFKQIDCYVEEIQRLNEKITENDNNRDYKKIIKDLNKEILEKKDIIRNLEFKISKKTSNEEKLQKEIESYRHRIIFYKDKIKICLGTHQNSNYRKNNSRTKIEDEYQKNAELKFRKNLNRNLRKLNIIENQTIRDHGLSNELYIKSEGNSHLSSQKNLFNFSFWRENGISINNNKYLNNTIYSDKEDESNNKKKSKIVDKKLAESNYISKKINKCIPRSSDKNYQIIEKSKDFDIDDPEKVGYLKYNYSPSAQSLEFNSDTECNNKFVNNCNKNLFNFDNENGEKIKKNLIKEKYKKNNKVKSVYKENENNEKIKSNNKTSQNSQTKMNLKKNCKSKVCSASKINCKVSAEYTIKPNLNEKIKIKSENDSTEKKQNNTKKYFKPIIGDVTLRESKEINKEKNLEKNEAKKKNNLSKLKNEKKSATISIFKQGYNSGTLNAKTKKMIKTTSGFNVHNNQNIPKPVTSNISRKSSREKNKDDNNKLMQIFNELSDDFNNNIEMLNRQEDQIKFMLSLIEK